ncbi:MAG: hypothetical protein IJH25_02030, partial [Clostridia bacterium]|nr:hypothetical protein [Clostridia bacterium]
IKDVAVIGLPHPRLGEIAAAIIELKPGAITTEEDIEKFCQDLPRYKRPRKIIFAEVPRNPTGKIEKPQLREIYGAKRLVAEQVGRYFRIYTTVSQKTNSAVVTVVKCYHDDILSKGYDQNEPESPQDLQS